MRITPDGTSRTSRDPIPRDQARLEEAMRQLEGVFVQELFKAMRQTVPDEGVVSGGSAEQIFTSLLDEHLASLVPSSWEHSGLEDALLRQFQDQLPSTDGDTQQDAGYETTAPAISAGDGA